LGFFMIKFFALLVAINSIYCLRLLIWQKI